MEYVIYKITHIDTGRCYVGQTRDFKKRMEQHVRRAKRSDMYRMYKNRHPLYEDLAKYGRTAFTFEVVERCATQEELNAREVFYINLLKCRVPAGYNVLPGGGNVWDDAARQEVADKISALHRDPEYQARVYPKLSHPAYNKGLPMPIEQRVKLSTIRHEVQKRPDFVHPSKGRVWTLEQRQTMSDVKIEAEAARTEAHPNLGMRRTEEAKAKMRAAKNPTPVLCLTNGQTYPSARAAAVALGLSPGNVAACVRGRLRQTKGFSFKPAHPTTTVRPPQGT